MYTFGQLKTGIRQIIWPTGEPDNLVAAHDKFFVDAMLDLQTWVKCLQQDHTDLIPQCATAYKCGLTVFDAPRGNILRVSVIDKIDPDTGLEDADADDDYCSEIVYSQIHPCQIKDYLDRSLKRGCCLSIPYFFCLPFSSCGLATYPVPTDVGLATGLPVLPLGYHYPQDSTDQTLRSQTGVWAVERGKIHLAPWIQSTETIIVKWDGIKRTWNDADPVDPDPQLAQAVEEYVRQQHASKYDKDEAEAMRAAGAYNLARQTLIYNCREETRVRACETSHARSSTISLSTLYYNDERQFTANCADGQTGTPVTVTVPAGTVGSNISVADANEKALQQAQTQAQAQLVCTDIPTTYWNSAQTATATCEQEEGAPPPVGNPVTVTIPAHSYSSTVSQSAADAAALAAAQAQAEAQLSCTYGNAEQSYTASCPEGSTGDDVTATVPANTYQSTVSQADADSQALTAATNEANTALVCSVAPTIWYNTAQTGQATAATTCLNAWGNYVPGIVTVTVTVSASTVTSTSGQSEANLYAQVLAQNFAQAVAAARAAAHQCGAYSTTYPNP